MNQVIQIVFWIVTSLISALAFVLWSKLKTVEEKAEKNENNLADFKTHVAESYANKKDIEDKKYRFS